MNVFLLFERGRDKYGIQPSIERAIAVCLDEEQAKEMLRTKLIEWARANPQTMLEDQRWEFDLGWPRTVEDLGDDEIIEMFIRNDTAPIVMEPVYLNGQLFIGDTNDALRMLAELVRPFDADAAEALKK
jgi:hypothetical protein